MGRIRAFLSDVVRQSDLVLLALCVTSTLFGMVLIASATYYRHTMRYVMVQGFGLFLGVLLYFFLSAVDVGELSKKWKWLLGFNVVFILLLRSPFGLARGLGCRGRVTSPTFTIVNEYEGKTPLFHFDMYCLGSSEELFDIGWDDYLARGGVCAVEWSERVSDALPEGTVFVDIARGAQGEDSRVITVTGGRFA